MDKDLLNDLINKSFGVVYSEEDKSLRLSPNAKTIVIPDNCGISVIGSYLFMSSDKLIATIGEGVEVLETSSFSNNKLIKVSLPSTLKEIQNGVFNCNQLQEVYLPKGVTTIGYLAFSDNPLSTVWIPSSVTYIDDSAFTDVNDDIVIKCTGGYTVNWCEEHGYDYELISEEEYTATENKLK